MQEQPSYLPPQQSETPNFYEQQPMQAPAPLPEPPKKSGTHKALIVTVILLVILVLGALGFIIYMLYSQPKPLKSEGNTTASTTTPTADTAEKVIASVKAALTDKLAQYKGSSIKDEKIAPSYKPSDKPYAVNGEFGTSLLVMPGSPTSEATNQTFQNTITDTLDSLARFTVTTNDWSKSYKDSTVICSVSTSGVPISVACANIAHYKDPLAKAEPFATAYLNSPDGKKSGEGVALGTITITKKTGGYSSATVSMGNTNSPVGGFAGLFYAKDDNWAYFIGTQSTLNCSSYNTYDIQTAFEGDTCVDTTTNKDSTVKVTLTK